MKKWLVLALAAAIAFPMATTHTANAETPNKSANQNDYHISLQPMDFNQVEMKLDQFFSNFTDLENFFKQIQISQPKQQPPTHAPTKLVQKPTTKKGNVKPSSDTLSQFEKQVVELTNKERTKRGLEPLKIDTGLAKMARDKSADMRDKNYFAHQSPTYGSPFEMMDKYGFDYTYAGENIAAGQQTPEEVVTAWMNSKGHRENILNPNYTTIGVGYVKGGYYGSYWTQEFIGH